MKLSRQAVDKGVEEAPSPAILPVEAADTGQAPVAQQPGEVPEHAASPSPPASVVAPSGILAGPWYYTARYLHRRPTPLKPIRPNYPPEAENLRGQVMLLLLINERGTVDTYHIVESQPPGVFDDAVSDAFAREQYAPGLITGYPVKSQLLVDVTFEPGSAPTAIILPGPSR